MRKFLPIQNHTVDILTHSSPASCRLINSLSALHSIFMRAEANNWFNTSMKNYPKMLAPNTSMIWTIWIFSIKKIVWSHHSYHYVFNCRSVSSVCWYCIEYNNQWNQFYSDSQSWALLFYMYIPTFFTKELQLTEKPRWNLVGKCIQFDSGRKSERFLPHSIHSILIIVDDNDDDCFLWHYCQVLFKYVEMNELINNNIKNRSKVWL